MYCVALVLLDAPRASAYICLMGGAPDTSSVYSKAPSSYSSREAELEEELRQKDTVIAKVQAHIRCIYKYFHMCIFTNASRVFTYVSVYFGKGP